MGRNVAGTRKEFTYYNRYQNLATSSFDSSLSNFGSFDDQWRLLAYEIPDRYVSSYKYNNAGDVDSGFTMTPYSLQASYFSLRYSATDNPLTPLSKSIFKNLAKYAIVDHLDNSYFESLLDICFFPSEMLASKIPTTSSLGSFGSLTDENTYNFIFQSNLPQSILVAHKEITSGAVSQTRIRFHYK
jgi:hypothetical protein